MPSVVLIILIWGGGEIDFIPAPFGFLLITQKQKRLQHWHFAACSRISLELLVPIWYCSPDPVFRYWTKLRGDISDFRISGPSLVKIKCHNFKTSNDIHMILGQVTWYNVKKIGDNIMLKNWDAIVIFPLYDQFEAIQKPDSGHIVCITYIYINSNLLFYRNWKQN